MLKHKQPVSHINSSIHKALSSSPILNVCLAEKQHYPQGQKAGNIDPKQATEFIHPDTFTRAINSFSVNMK